MIDDSTTRALSLYQPWASAIVHGSKRIENRPIPPPANIVGQRIFIHAAKTWDAPRAASVVKLWREEKPAGLRAVLRSLTDKAVAEREDDFLAQVLENYAHLGSFLGSARVIGTVTTSAHGHGTLSPRAKEVARAGASWLMGPFGWVLDEVRALETHIPAEPGVFHRGVWKIGSKDAELLGAAKWKES